MPYSSSSGFLLHSCWRNPSLLIVEQHRSLATWLQFGPVASSRSSHQHIFGWPLGHLWSHGHHSVTHLVHLLSFSHDTCPAHWCLLVWIWWTTSMTPVFEWIQLALFLSCSVSPIIICSILYCVVTIFCSCVLLRDHVSLPYVITGSMHSLCTFVLNLSGILLFCITESSLPKVVHTRPILHLNSYSWSWSCHHLTKVDVVVNFFIFLPLMLMSVLLTAGLHMTLVFPRCLLRPTGLLDWWMSCTIFCSSEVDLAISTMSSAKMRWDRYSPSILIPLSFQFILPTIASCRHDMKSLDEML